VRRDAHDRHQQGAGGGELRRPRAAVARTLKMRDMFTARASRCASAATARSSAAASAPASDRARARSCATGGARGGASATSNAGG
jgi:hypothetical protein